MDVKNPVLYQCLYVVFPDEDIIFLQPYIRLLNSKRQIRQG